MMPDEDNQIGENVLSEPSTQPKLGRPRRSLMSQVEPKMKPQEQVTQEHSVTVRAVAELLQVEAWDKVPAAVMQALAQVLICADEECHPLTAALSVLDDSPVERRFEAFCIAARIEPNSRERRCYLCGYEWTGTSALCPSCRDGYSG